jgi:predicted MPP superfamily phosphohydrolase
MVPTLDKGLAVIAPTYYVTGNHEWSVEWGGEKDFVHTLKSMLTGNGVTVLSNEYVLLERGGASVVLAGVDDPNGYADQKTPVELYAEITEEWPGLFSLLLAHRNDAIEEYAAAGYDFVMSGHGHGGIVRLPFTDGLLSPARTFFPTWTAGLYRVGNTTLFVSRGLGNNTEPINGFRLFNRPDLAVLELKSTK